MAELFHDKDVPQHYCWDRKYYNTKEDQEKALIGSRTVYIGNLSFFTSEVQLNETFSVAGPIKRIIMGLNSFTKTPCGFAFAEYYTTEHAAACLNNVSGTICDDRQIRCDMDAGFKPGRQFGRGQSGGQTRDERRKEIDLGRGGVKAKAPPPPVRPQQNKRDRNERESNINHDRRGGSDMREIKSSDKFGRDNDRAERKIVIVADQYKKSDPLVDGLSASRPAPRVQTPYVVPPSFTAVDLTPTAAELLAAEEIEEEERQSKKGRL